MNICNAYTFPLLCWHSIFRLQCETCECRWRKMFAMAMQWKFKFHTFVHFCIHACATDVISKVFLLHHLVCSSFSLPFSASLRKTHQGSTFTTHYDFCAAYNAAPLHICPIGLASKWKCLERLEYLNGLTSRHVYRCLNFMCKRESVKLFLCIYGTCELALLFFHFSAFLNKFRKFSNFRFNFPYLKIKLKVEQFS